MIDSIAKLQYFSDCKSSPCGEIVKEQLQIDYNFIDFCAGDLRPSNHEVVPVRRVFRHAGMNVIKERLLGVSNSRVVRKKPSWLI